MSEFDPMKALREELAGRSEVMTAIRQIEQKLEAEIAAAERGLNAARKIIGWLRIDMDQKREQLRKLEALAEAKE